MIIKLDPATFIIGVVGAALAPPVRLEGRSTKVGRSEQRPYGVPARFALPR